MPSSRSWITAPPSEAWALGLAVTGAGYELSKTEAVRERTLPLYAGVLVTEGTGRLSIASGRTNHRVRPGTFFWLPADTPHSYSPDTTWSEHWVLFGGRNTTLLEDAGLLAAGPAAVRPRDADDCRALLQQIQTLAGQTQTLRTHIAASAALQKLICSQPTDPAPARDPQQDIAVRALHMLTQEGETVSVARVAKQLAISQDALTVAVRRLTGTTPAQYARRHRLERAKLLLNTSDLPIIRIARQLGYQDPAYFARTFTRYTGKSPSRYRQEQTEAS